MGKDRHKNRTAHNFVDLTGRRFGKLVVISDSGRRKSKRPIWICKCDCDTQIEVNGKYLLCGDTKSCGCITKGNAHNRNAVGEITMSFWHHIFRAAKKRGVPFQISREFAWDLYLKQDRLCAVSGVAIGFALNTQFPERIKQTASLDRKDSSLGYTEDNIQWVHKKANIMKNAMSNAELYEWCSKIQSWMSPRLELQVV